MSTFGSLYRVHTYGESHCKSVGAIVDGIPPVRPSLSKEKKVTRWDSEFSYDAG
jgi:chorismate synthase